MVYADPSIQSIDRLIEPQTIAHCRVVRLRNPPKRGKLEGVGVDVDSDERMIVLCSSCSSNEC